MSFCAGTDWTSFSALWSCAATIPSVWKGTVAAAISFWPIFKAIQAGLDWKNRQRVVEKIEAVRRRPGAPELSAASPHLQFTIAGPGPLERIIEVVHYGVLTVQSRNRAPPRRHVLARASDFAEVWEIKAITLARDTRGLNFLPYRVRHPLHLHLALKFLKTAEAPAEALEKIERRLRDVPSGPLFDCLFSPPVLKEVDLSSDVHRGNDYFTKYFQPLMVAFDSQSFAESAGIPSEPERRALTEHLSSLSDRRIVAMWVTSSGHIDRSRLLQRLPVEINAKGFDKPERSAAKLFNQKKAVRSVVMISDSDAIERARLVETETNAQFQKARVATGAWTPLLDDLAAVPVFFWQEIAT